MDPSELALKADAYWSLRQRRLELSREVDRLKEEENGLRDELIDTLDGSPLKTIGGNLCTISLKPDEEPIVTNWDALYEHIQSTGHFDLLQKRLGVTAARERYDVDGQLPGTEMKRVNKLSVRKA